ncbi:hypothetical protein ACUN9Y_21475 [Halomonas sp. V046]|uniref:hypothetical protein n=1 Tax=Halomonas sp. V046 TaxID=3459611 RepID=UPI004044E5BB
MMTTTFTTMTFDALFRAGLAMGLAALLALSAWPVVAQTQTHDRPPRPQMVQASAAAVAGEREREWAGQAWVYAESVRATTAQYDGGPRIQYVTGNPAVRVSVVPDRGLATP